jgi:hypothetical protein
MVAYFLVAALVVLYIVRSVRTYLSLKQFGGHWSAGWSRLWLLKTQSSGEMHHCAGNRVPTHHLQKKKTRLPRQARPALSFALVTRDGSNIPVHQQ